MTFRPKMSTRVKKFWRAISHWMWKYFGGLVMEEKNGVQAISIGRTSFLIVFGILIYHWTNQCVPWEGTTELPPGLLEAFFALAGYILGGKLAGAIRRPIPSQGLRQ